MKTAVSTTKDWDLYETNSNQWESVLSLCKAEIKIEVTFGKYLEEKILSSF
jgi:hypothetical protein